MVIETSVMTSHTVPISLQVVRHEIEEVKFRAKIWEVISILQRVEANTYGCRYQETASLECLQQKESLISNHISSATALK